MVLSQGLRFFFRLSVFSLFLTFMCFAVRVEASLVTLTPEERAWLIEHDGAIILAPCPDYPPIDFTNSKGTHVGLTSDYVTWIENDLGFHFKKVLYANWYAMLRMAEKKEIDVITAIQKTPERSRYLDFTHPYIHIPNIIVTRKSKRKLYSPNDLARLRVLVVQGYAVENYMRRKYPQLNYEYVPDELTGLMKVSFSQADAMVVSLSTASYYIEQKDITNLKAGAEVGYDWSLRFGVRNDWPVLVNILNKALTAMPDKTRRLIHNRWVTLHGDALHRYKAFLVILALSFTAILIIIVAVIVLNRILRREVRRRTRQLEGELAERRRAEKRLSEEKERLLVTIHSIGEAFISSDLEGRIILMNSVAEKLIGVPEKEAVGMRVAEICGIIDKENDSMRFDPVRAVLESGRPVQPTENYLLLSAGGVEKSVLLSAAPIRDSEENVRGAVLVLNDITERLRIHEERDRLQRLESLGLLAGGIAHDFNNILAAILGNANLLEYCYQSDGPVREGDNTLELLKEIEDATIRAKGLTFQLLSFAKGGEPVKKAGSIKKVLTDSVTFALRGSGVRPEFIIADELWNVEFDHGQLSQVFDNLALNARHAMPDGGTLTVKAENINHTPASEDDTSPPRQVRISMTDTGCGIEEENLSKIFDPYFTTRAAGSGLGLASVFSIVSMHGGRVDVESTVGAGSTFSVYLPSLTDAPAVNEQRYDSMIKHASGRLLFMDDQENLRLMVRRMLEGLGYEVLLADGGEGALSLYRGALDSGVRIDAVILDLTVPGGMGGVETLRRMKELDPDVKAIMASGYSEERGLSRYREYGFMAFVAKPFTLKELAAALEEVLTGRCAD